MEVYKYRIKRSNPSVYFTVPCTGGTNFYPINTSPNCSGLTMYNSTFSQVQNALQGDMNNFPTELTGCSSTNPCILLNDTTTMPVMGAPPPYGNAPTMNQPFCLDVESHPYVIFAGLNLYQSGVMTFTGESYDDLISIFSLTNSTLSQPLNTQTSAHLTPNTVSCFCPPPVFNDLHQIPIFLEQDFNDIGHYDIWDGNLGQKDIFSNFIVTATTAMGNQIQIYNTTDFGYYKTYQNSPYTIEWGDCPCDCVTPPCTNSFGDPCCETLQFPNLTNPTPHTYAGVGQRRITITHQNEWGPTSVSQVITVPFMPYNTLQAQPYNSVLNTGIAPSNAPVVGPTGPTGTNTYFGAYPFSPLDSGTDILQYSGMSPIFGGGNNSNCFEVTGNTQSLLGAFQTYTSLQTGNLPPGYQINVDVPIMGEVINPITNLIEQGVMGRITVENTQYTAYTISIGTNTPITFYDFSNGVTLYEATSCGMDAFAFGAFDCVKCAIEDCTYCETKDEYIDRITTLPEPISFDPMINTNWGEWSATTNYVKGDIVFDSTWGECCCYMAVTDINQSGGTIDPWAGIKPTDLVQGVWWNNGQPTEHIWEACTPECESCPDFTAIPCYDPTNTWNAYPTISPVGPAGVYSNGNVYSTGQFTLGQWGNCYRALSGGTLPPPSGLTNNQYWDYIGCSSWVCPPVSALTASSLSCQLVPGTGSTNTGPCTSVGFTAFEDCMDTFYLGNCCEDRYVCEDQYSCGNCIEITSAHPLYNDPSGLDPNQGPVFDSEIDCNNWCNPPAFSCTTSSPAAGGNCCQLLSCDEDLLNGTSFYVDSVLPVMSTLPPTPAPFLNFVDYAAFNFELFFDPYDISDCNGGFTNSAGTYTGCCDYTRWIYNCEEGCKPVYVGTGYTDEASCYAANPQWLGIGNTPCGWVCDPMCDPCTTCSTLNCGYAYDLQGHIDCEMNCSCSTVCYVCDCTNPTPCTIYQDPITNAASCPYWPPNPFGSPPTFPDLPQCQTGCTCPGGFDCFVYDDTNPPAQIGQQVGGCTYYASEYVMIQLGVTWSPGSPTDPFGNPTGYTSFEECCNATECCRAVCEDDPIQAGLNGWSAYTTTGPALQGGGGGQLPCYWISQTNLDLQVGPTNVNCCSPAYVNSMNGLTGIVQCFDDNPGLPYCDMIDCVNALCPDPDPLNTTGMTCCAPVEETCNCACEDWLTVNGIPITSAFTWSGPWSNTNTYNMFETVSYSDGNTPECCFMCMCPPDITGTGYDCDSSPPDDGPYTVNGPPNCWQTCERLPAYDPATPVPTIGDPCGPCDGPSSAATMWCTPSGCTSGCGSLPSSTASGVGGIFDPPPGVNVSIWATQNNCYTGGTCSTPLIGMGIDQCTADCYCADPGPPAGLEPVDVSNCVVMQDYLNDIYSPGTGNLGIHFNGYSPFPFTWPPVQPGIVFQMTGVLTTWPYGSLDLCQSQIDPGFAFCCTGNTSIMTWECDSSCNCPTVAGNPCVGGVGCYPVMGSGGTFTSLSGCQEWCTWECNSQGAQTCQFIPMSLASVTYPSATACELANTNCLCQNLSEEWWCDWAGADAGLYDTPGSQPCQPSSYFVGQGSAYQSQAIGQAAGGPSDPNNNYFFAVTLGNVPTGMGFPTQAQCEERCRFCCDCAPPGTGVCDLCGDPTVVACAWGDMTCSGGTASCGTGLPSSTSPGDCAQQQLTVTGDRTCREPQTEYCCHAVDGCLSYIGTPPMGSDGNPCVTFFGTNAAACTDECNFVCGDCVPPAGDCHCQFVNGPVSPSCSPYPFTNMLDCETYVQSLTLFGADGSCCRCYHCTTNSPITYQMYDTGTMSWVLGSTPVNMSTGALPWVSGQVYNIGDVVTFSFDNTSCCYVNVWDTSQDWTVPPYFYYQAYINDLNTSNPVWPGGGTLSLQWIPCDPDCVPGVMQQTYDCIPGTITDSCSNRNLVVPPTATLNQYDLLEVIGAPAGVPYLQTTDVMTIKFPYYGPGPIFSNPCTYAAGTPNAAPLYQVNGPIVIHPNVGVMIGIPGSYNTWSSMITSLAGAGVTSPSGTILSLSSSWDDVCLGINAIWGSYLRDKCMDIQMTPCRCTQTPCVCVQVNGPTGAFNSLSGCQTTLNYDPCCGSWKCDPKICDCTFIPNDITGFSSQTECYNSNNCCTIRYDEYECRKIPIIGPVGANNFKCECVVVPAGMGSYTGPNALFDCENDPTTCCSGRTMPDMWRCTKDCSCVIDPTGPYSTLHDCQTAINNNCCYTGVTKDWECVDFGPKAGGCKCVQTASGVWPTQADCEAQVNDCCYTGHTGRYDCVPGNNGLCKCVVNVSGFGTYATLSDCQNGIPVSNCCENQSTDCSTECPPSSFISPTYVHHNGTYSIGFTQTLPLASSNIAGLWLSGTIYTPFDIVKDPYDDCCYVLVCDNCHFTGSDIMSYSPSQIYQNHLLGKYYNGTQDPTPVTPEINIQNRGPIWWPCDPKCSTTPPDIGYDCVNCPGSCNCIQNNTGTAQYQGPNALSLCIANCKQGCEDCAQTLSGYLTGPIDYEGIWYSTFNPAYVENDCVTDPDDGCCYCCVPYPFGPDDPHDDDDPHSKIKRNDGTISPAGPGGSGPGGSGPGGSGPSPTKVICKSGYQPSLNVGVNIGGGAMWMDCKVTTDGSPCDNSTGAVDCNNCDTYMSTNWGATLPLQWKTPAYQHFYQNQCVVDPNDGCCYCCMMSPNVDPNDFGSGWVDHDDPVRGPGFSNSSPCAVYDTNQDGNWEYYGAGVIVPFTDGNIYGWVSCTPSGSFPCSGVSGSIYYDCLHRPTIFDPSNHECVPVPGGPYTSLQACQNSPCPPPVTPCNECCGKLKKDGTWIYQTLPTTYNPCDCEFWLGIGWVTKPTSDCCVPPTWACPIGQVWSQSDCSCVPIVIGPGGPIEDDWVTEEPCIQTESCPEGYQWDWDRCQCMPT